MNNFFAVTLIAFSQLVTATLLMIATNAHGESISKNFSISDTVRPDLTVQDIRKRFELNTQTVVSDSIGRLKHIGTKRSQGYTFDEKGELTVYEMSREPGRPDLALKMVWKFADDGVLTAHIQQFESMENNPRGEDPKLGKLIREEKISLKDFAPIDWLAFNKDGKRVIVRLTPMLAERDEDPVDVKAASLSFLDPVMFDNKGFFWARGDGPLEGRYLSVRTHMGQVSLSFVPFKGSKVIGVAQGNQITIDGPSQKIFIRSAQPVVIGSRPVNVYGAIDLEKRTAKPNAVHVQSGDKEKEFLRDL